MGPDDGADRDDATAFDPFADLFFTLIAAVLPAILVLLPTALHQGAAVPAGVPGRDAPPPAEIANGGHRVRPIVAERDGLRLTGDGDRLVGLDGVPDDPGLRRFLEGLRDGDEPLLVVVEPGGLEASFLLEPVAALHGPATMRQVRLAEACAGPRGRAPIRTCAAAGATARTGSR